MSKRRLIIRLSSLGDIVLATTVLDSRPEMLPIETHWIVAKEFAELLRGDSRVSKIIEFDRRDGLAGWMKLCRTLIWNNYSEVFDLHRTYRSLFLKLSFAMHGQSKLVWKNISKQRLRRAGYFLCKALWPKMWRPTHWVRRYGELVENLSAIPKVVAEAAEGPPEMNGIGDYWVAMPSSRWRGKEWPATEIIKVMKASAHIWVILGTKGDSQSELLANLCQSEGVEHVNLVGKLSLKQLKVVVAKSRGYLGTDTGIMHLAEALGVPVVSAFGPSTPDCGFGPRLENSQAWVSNLWCSPCGKDGRSCIRPLRRFKCMEGPFMLSDRQEQSALPTFRMRAYRFLVRHILLRIVFGFRGLRLKDERALRMNLPFPKIDKERIIWFHAASAGELETLIPVIEEILKLGVRLNSLVITVFSHSGLASLKKWVEQQGANRPAYFGLSPLEGYWEDEIRKLNLRLFVSVKYEAWPELWSALGRRGIGLAIVSARLRKSLKVCRQILRLLGECGPKSHYYCSVPSDWNELKSFLAPGESGESLGEPRWDRINNRLARMKDNEPLIRFSSMIQESQRRVIVLGSVWPEDLDVWQGVLVKNELTMLWVPHQLSDSILLQEYLRNLGVKTALVSAWESGKVKEPETVLHWIVDKMGWLAELYRFGDLAYVGGGFGKGIHSTMEPGVQTIPIACGPVSFDKFSEAVFLSSVGMLTVVQGKSDLRRWWETQITGNFSRAQKEAWKAALQSQWGASKRVAASLIELKSGKLV